MHALKRFGFLILLWVASVLGMNALTAAPIPQVENQVEKTAVIIGKEVAEPWETPTDLSLFFAGRIDSKLFKTRAFLDIASSLLKAGQKEHAVSVLMQASAVAEQEGAASLVNTAALLSEAGHQEQAMKLLMQAREIAEESPNPYSKLTSMIQVVTTMAKIDAMDQAVKAAQQIKVAEGQTSLWVRVATSLVATGHGRQAIAILGHAMNAANEIDNEQAKTDVSRLITQAVGKAGDVVALTQAAELAGQMSDAYSKTMTLANIARAIAKEGDNERAIIVAELAVVAAADVPDSQKNGARSIIATVLAKAGNFDRAIELAGEIETLNGKSIALTSIASALATIDPQKAMTTLAEAAELAQGIESANVKRSVLQRIAAALVDAGDTEQALTTLSEAGELAQGIDAASLKASVLQGIAAELVRAGDAKQGLTILKQALAAAFEIENGYGKTAVLVGIATRLTDANATQEAREALRHAANAATEISDANSKSLALSVISSGLAKMGEKERAAEIVRLASKSAENIVDPQQRTSALRAIANTATRSGDKTLGLETLMLAVESGEKGQDQFKRGVLNGIARELVKVGGVEPAMRAIQTTTEPSSRVMSLQLIASTLTADGNREQELELLAKAIDIAANIKGDKSYESALTRIARSLSTETDRDGPATGAMKLSFSPKELALAKRLVKATQRENRFIQNLHVVIISTAKLSVRPSTGGKTLQSLRPDEQNGVLRLEQNGRNLTVTGLMKNLEPGEHEILVQATGHGVPGAALPPRSLFSSLDILQQPGSSTKEQGNGDHLKLTPTVSVTVEKLGQVAADATGAARIQLLVSGRSLADLLGRPVFVRAINRDQIEPKEITEAIAGWGFIMKPDDSLAMTDDQLWGQVFPDLRSYDLPKNSYERALLASLPRPGRPSRYDRPEIMNSAGLKAIELDGNSGHVTTSIRHDGRQPITLEAWVKPENLSGHREVISNAQGAGAVLGFYDGVCKFLVHDGSRYREVAATELTHAKKTVHIAGVFDGKRMSLFVDGRKQGTGALLARPGKPSRFPFLIGANPEANRPPIKFFSGVIDHVRFSKTARYRDDFVPERPLATDDDTLAVYHFDDGSGDLAKDSSGNGFDGRVRGGTHWITDAGFNKKPFTGPTVAEELWNTPTRFSLFVAQQVADPGSKTNLLAGVDWDLVAAEEKERALADLKRAAQSNRRSSAFSSIASDKTRVALALARAGDAKQALAILTQATNQAQENTSLVNRIYDQWKIVSALADIGSVDQALKLADEIEEPPVREDRPTSGIPAHLHYRRLAESSLVTAMVKAGNRQQAAELLKQTVNRAERLSNDSAKASILSGVAVDLAETGEIQQSLELVEKIENTSSKASTLNRIATILVAAGDKQQAAIVLQQAIESTQTIESLSTQAMLLASIASNLDESGDKERAQETRKHAATSAKQAVESARRSLVAAQRRGDVNRTTTSGGVSSRITWLIRHATMLGETGEKDLATAALKQAIAAIEESPPRTDQGKVIALTSIAEGMAKAGDSAQALDVLKKAMRVAQQMERSNGISLDNQREQAIANIANILSQGVTEQDPFRRKIRRAAKKNFTTKEREFARQLVEDLARTHEITAARKRLSVGASPATIQQLLNHDDPEIAWLAAFADFKRRSMSLYRADRIELQRVIADLKTLVGDRNFDSEAHRTAEGLARSIARTEHQDLLASLYQFMGEKMSESTDTRLQYQAPKMLGIARRMQLPGKSMQVSGTTVDGKEFDWSSYRGKVVLVEFWGSRYLPCRKEHRAIRRSLEAYGEKGFAVVGVNLDSTSKACEDYIEQQGLTWPTLFSLNPRERGTRNPIAANYAITSIPTGFLVDKTGKVVSVKARGKNLDRLLQEVLGDPSGAPKETQAIASIKFAPVKQFDISPDSQRIAAVSEETDQVGLWDARSGKQLHALVGHAGGVSAIAFASDGKRIASGGVDGTARVWDATSGEEVLKLEAHQQYVHGVSFSPDGKWLATSGRDDQMVKLWNTATGELSHSFKHPSYVASVVFSPDGTRIAAGGRNKPFSGHGAPSAQFPGACVVKIWNVATGQETASLEGTGWAANKTRFSPDGKIIASAGIGKARAWEARGGRELFTTKHRIHYGASLFSVSFSPDSRWLVTAGANEEAVAWDTATGKELFALQHPGRLSRAIFSHDGRWLVTGTTTGVVTLWNTTNRSRVLAQQTHTGSVHVRFSSDDSLFVSSSIDGLIKVWDISDMARAADQGAAVADTSGEMERNSRDRSSRPTGIEVSSTKLGDLSLRGGKLEDALTQFRQALRFNQDYAPAHVGIANVLGKQGKHDQALEEFRIAIKLDPNHAIAHNSFAWTLVTHPQQDGSYRDVPEAVAAAKKACDLDLDNHLILNTLGVALYRNGDWKEAIETLHDSVVLGSDDPYNWLFIAMSHWQLGDQDQARKLYDKSIAWAEKNKVDQELQSFFAEAKKVLGPKMKNDAAMPAPEAEHGGMKDAPSRPISAIAPFDGKQAKQFQEAWADHLAVEIQTTNSIGIKMQIIPPGEFLMGSSKEEISQLLTEAVKQKLPSWQNWIGTRTEGPQHKVTITEPFSLSIHEVTRAQFRKFVEATGYKTDAEKDWRGGFGWQGESWVQARGLLWSTNLGFEQTDDQSSRTGESGGNCEPPETRVEQHRS